MVRREDIFTLTILKYPVYPVKILLPLRRGGLCGRHAGLRHFPPSLIPLSVRFVKSVVNQPLTGKIMHRDP